MKASKFLFPIKRMDIENIEKKLKHLVIIVQKTFDFKNISESYAYEVFYIRIPYP